jgi:hypothetical protein
MCSHSEANYTYEGFLNNFLDAIDGSYCSYSAFGETGNSPLDPPYPDPAPGGYVSVLPAIMPYTIMEAD